MTNKSEELNNLLNHINKQIANEHENLNCFYDYQKMKNTEEQKQIIESQIAKHQHALRLLYGLKSNKSYKLKRKY